MAIFSKLKGAKRAAEQHKGAAQQAQAHAAELENPDKPVPYKHTPTHAAIDALSGAPSTWKNEDRQAIKAHHKRRSMMSRNNSNLSTTAPVTRSSSYYGSQYGSQVAMAPVREEARPHQVQQQYYQPHQPYTHETPKQPHPNREVSPLSSSGNSTSSASSHLELPQRQPAKKVPDLDIFAHIHQNPNRKVGEAPLYDSPPVRSMPAPTASTSTSNPVQQKRRAFGFGKKSSAIAAH